ncbi:Isochorismatase hydrolase [Diaporthe eres]|uniref:Isochorismatase-like domain-containing protein n=1 Tax=Diaporthe vaccinii TaxID=105482 RepID=A0ABR4DYX9_9PEZI|nr:Isochorismatase hydrolase [Diaporthe eres]
MTEILKSHPALLIIDMQNGLCHQEGCFGKLEMPVSNHLAIVETINKLRAASHAAKIPVISTRLCYNEDYSDAGVQMEEQAQIKELRGLIRGTWDADVLDELAPDTTRGEIVINKNRNSAFFNTGLEDLLRSHGVNQLLCTRVGSNVCVESTVRDGAARDYYCKTLSNATATLTMEDHNACMKNLVWFGGVVTADDILWALKQRQEKG